MNFSNFDFMAKSGRRRSRLAYVGTTISIALLLLLLMIVGYSYLQIDNLSQRVKSQVQIDVFFYDSTPTSDIIRIEKQIVTQPSVLNATYVSKDSALSVLTAGLGEEYTNFMEVNPLQASVNVHLKEAQVHPDSAAAFENWLLETHPEEIEEVFYDPKQFASVNQSLSNAMFYMIAFALLLLFVAIALIFITVRLSVYSQRFTLRTMQLVGAKTSFIKRPFLLNAVFLGLASGLLAILMFIGIGYFLSEWRPDFWFGDWGGPEKISLQTGGEQQDFKIFAILFGCIVVGGVVISYLSTTFALRKYIWMKTDKLY